MDEDEIRDIYTNEDFKHGIKVGKSLGHYEAVEEAIRAHKAGRIDEWIEAVRPKSLEGWDEYYEAHPEKEW